MSGMTQRQAESDRRHRREDRLTKQRQKQEDRHARRDARRHSDGINAILGEQITWPPEATDQ